MKRTNEERIAKIEECTKSGMTEKEWCEETGINYYTYIGWKRRLGEKKTTQHKKIHWIEATQEYKDKPVMDEMKTTKRHQVEKRIIIVHGKLEISIREQIKQRELVKIIQAMNQI